MNNRNNDPPGKPTIVQIPVQHFNSRRTDSPSSFTRDHNSNTYNGNDRRDRDENYEQNRNLNFPAAHSSIFDNPDFNFNNKRGTFSNQPLNVNSLLNSAGNFEPHLRFSDANLPPENIDRSSSSKYFSNSPAGSASSRGREYSIPIIHSNSSRFTNNPNSNFNYPPQENQNNYNYNSNNVYRTAENDPQVNNTQPNPSTAPENLNHPTEPQSKK
jgi:hypothetical protein